MIKTGFYKIFSNAVSNAIFYWFPVLPFLAYWIIAYLILNFGPFITPELSFFTHVYVVLYILIFAISYRLGLKIWKFSDHPCDEIDDKLALKILSKVGLLSLIGTILFVYDRITAGAGSFDAVQNELSKVRGDSAERITFLTTLAVIPQSFRMVAFATYFYCMLRRLSVSINIHLTFFLMIMLELTNMVLSANRGSLFWIISYGLFFVIFCLKINIFSDFFSLKYLKIRFFILTLILVSYLYFLWVAENRVVSATAEYLGRQAFDLLKDPTGYSSDDYSTLGAKHQFFYYLTHGFEYTDAILKNAAIINFDFISPLGIRVESQISRIIPEYVFPAKINILAWVLKEGLSTSGWPTIFGASLAYFGILGSLIFVIFLGYICGFVMRKWLKSSRLGWLILILLIFSSLNMSFDWIIRDFEQFVALVFGVFLVRQKKKIKVSV
jgi:oligosaccharide repeat unit polymerase